MDDHRRLGLQPNVPLPIPNRPTSDDLSEANSPPFNLLLHAEHDPQLFSQVSRGLQGEPILVVNGGSDRAQTGASLSELEQRGLCLEEPVQPRHEIRRLPDGEISESEHRGFVLSIGHLRSDIQGMNLNLVHEKAAEMEDTGYAAGGARVSRFYNCRLDYVRDMVFRYTCNIAESLIFGLAIGILNFSFEKLKQYVLTMEKLSLGTYVYGEDLFLISEATIFVVEKLEQPRLSIGNWSLWFEKLKEIGFTMELLKLGSKFTLGFLYEKLFLEIIKSGIDKLWQPLFAGGNVRVLYEDFQKYVSTVGRLVCGLGVTGHSFESWISWAHKNRGWSVSIFHLYFLEPSEVMKNDVDCEEDISETATGTSSLEKVLWYACSKCREMAWTFVNMIWEADGELSVVIVWKSMKHGYRVVWCLWYKLLWDLSMQSVGIWPWLLLWLEELNWMIFARRIEEWRREFDYLVSLVHNLLKGVGCLLRVLMSGVL